MKPEDRVNELLGHLANASFATKEDVERFYRDWQEAVWNWKLSSVLFDFYDPKIHVYRENGNDRHDVREIVKEVLEIQAAFPDIKIRVEAMVITGNEKDGYQVWARRYLNGTNLGYSRYGAPTQGTLDGDLCMSLDMLKLQCVDGKWKVVNEYLMYSERTIRMAMGGPAEVS